jgi:hypothetical protein
MYYFAAACRPTTSSSTIHHPCVYVSMSGGKSPCSFLRNNPIGHYTQKGGTCRAVTRSPVDFREGRRASDGLVAQGLLSQVDNPFNNVAFNSQRLHEACKAKGVLELHLLQQEAAQLNSQYQSNVPPDELNVRQIQHSQFHITPVKNDISLFHNGGCCVGNGGNKAGNYQESCNYFNKTVNDITTYVGIMKNDLVKHDNGDLIKHLVKAESPQQKPPLQQQLMQHRLLQQKRQILQKQGALEAGMSRRQMLRQQSYKMAQAQQVLPPLQFPLSESESEDLLAFQQIVENPSASSIPASSLMSASSPKIIKTTHLHGGNIQSSLSPSLSPQPTQQITDAGYWNNLPTSLQNSCQISEVTTNTSSTASHELFHQAPLYHQVFYYR